MDGRWVSGPSKVASHHLWGLNFRRLRVLPSGAACKDNTCLKLLYDFETDDSGNGASALPTADLVSCCGLSCIEAVPDASQYFFASLLGFAV